VEESTAIGTSYLRAQLVPSPEGPEISSRLRDYVDVRLEFSRARTDLDRQTARARAARVEDEVWSRAESSIYRIDHGRRPCGQCPYGQEELLSLALDVKKSRSKATFFCQTQLCMLAWPKYLRQASVSAALANRI
jgi:hypothetical protein